jgi:hypothetical protein
LDKKEDESVNSPKLSLVETVVSLDKNQPAVVVEEEDGRNNPKE